MNDVNLGNSARENDSRRDIANPPATLADARDTKAGPVALSVATEMDAGKEVGSAGTPPSSDRRVIACNMNASTSAHALGSLAYVMQLTEERARILVRSRSGRWVRRWVPIAKLSSFRFKNLPPEHPLYVDLEAGGCFTQEALDSLACRTVSQRPYSV